LITNPQQLLLVKEITQNTKHPSNCNFFKNKIKIKNNPRKSPIIYLFIYFLDHGGYKTEALKTDEENFRIFSFFISKTFPWIILSFSNLVKP
jgi:hypothetical protein